MTITIESLVADISKQRRDAQRRFDESVDKAHSIIARAQAEGRSDAARATDRRPLVEIRARHQAGTPPCWAAPNSQRQSRLVTMQGDRRSVAAGSMTDSANVRYGS